MNHIIHRDSSSTLVTFMCLSASSFLSYLTISLSLASFCLPTLCHWRWWKCFVFALLSPWQPSKGPKQKVLASRKTVEFTEALGTNRQGEMGRGRQPFRGEHGEWAGRMQRDDYVLLSLAFGHIPTRLEIGKILSAFFTLCPLWSELPAN